MAQINIQKKVYDKQNFSKVIDTQFRQFFISDQQKSTPTFTLDDFFHLYEQLFYQIPKEGDSNSHRYMLEKSAKYLGVVVSQDDIQALLNEITTLRQQVLDTQTALDEITKTLKK